MLYSSRKWIVKIVSIVSGGLETSLEGEEAGRGSDLCNSSEGKPFPLCPILRFDRVL
jgi:hypothetical protein